MNTTKNGAGRTPIHEEYIFLPNSFHLEGDSEG